MFTNLTKKEGILYHTCNNYKQAFPHIKPTNITILSGSLIAIEEEAVADIGA